MIENNIGKNLTSLIFVNLPKIFIWALLGNNRFELLAFSL